MKNTYYFLRHGQSKANVAGIILSGLEEGKKSDYTLTEVGEAEILTSVVHARDQGILDQSTLIFSSPFSRCARSAEIVKEVLGLDQEISFDDRLRERWFGDWEHTSNEHYERVWEDDRLNSAHTIANVESADDVQRRTIALIQELEERYRDRVILLVSHGDALQILHTGLKGVSAATHRELAHLKTAEIRRWDVS